jgi:NAD(P)-dependent dehydrogenase (short-subunit alcohol dehydrogenase family)
MPRLDGRVALVTGAARGLGAGIALSLAREGASVVVNDLAPAEEMEASAAAVLEAGARALVAQADVRSEEQVEAMFRRVDAEFGRIDILVNNAGIVRRQDIFETTLEDWRAVLDTHLTGMFLCSRAAMLRMRERRWGRIIQISSVVAFRGAIRGFVHYAAAKGGQVSFTRTLARTAAPYGITVNAVAPGVIETEMLREAHGEAGIRELDREIPLGLGTPGDVGAAVAFLASEEARHITGATLDVNGGMYFR